MAIDELDEKILRELLRDARQSYRELAGKVGISVGTAVARTKRMEKEGIVKGYGAILDHEKLGYEFTAVTEVTVAKGKLIDVENEISKMASVCAVYDVTGVPDCVVVSKFKSRRDLSKFTKTLLSIPYVERTNTHVVLNTVKEDFRLL